MSLIAIVGMLALYSVIALGPRPLMYCIGGGLLLAYVFNFVGV